MVNLVVTDEDIRESTILIVDDNPDNVFLYETIVTSHGYKVLTAYDGQQALDISCQRALDIDLIMLDIMMPGIDGLETTRILKNNLATRHIPIVLLTAKIKERGDVARGLEFGADDYLTKPVESVELMARAASLLKMKKLQDKLRGINETLEHLVEERTFEIIMTRNTAIAGLAKLAEYRDNETGAHLTRVKQYVELIAEYLRKKEKYKDIVDDEYIRNIVESCVLHDIGKVGVPDSILRKPGKLTKEEFEIMKTHSAIGGSALVAADRRGFTEDNFLSMGRDIAMHHHEKWNGEGYPKGISGVNIPLAARIMALADVYDALVSKRVYKEAFPHSTATEIIVSAKEKQFDPDIVEAYLSLEDEFRAITENRTGE